MEKIIFSWEKLKNKNNLAKIDTSYVLTHNTCKFM